VITLLRVFSFVEAKFCQGCRQTNQFSLNRKVYDSRFSDLRVMGRMTIAAKLMISDEWRFAAHVQTRNLPFMECLKQSP
jgi:hypothetical protein